MPDISTDILTIVEVAVIILIAWLLSQLLSRVITHGARRAGVSPRVISYIRVALNALWIIVAVTSILSISSLAPLLSSALTVSGLVTLAVSLALQNTFSNMIAGILLFQDNTLRIGDDIQYSGIRGRVVRVWLRTTWVQTDDGNIAIISNSTLSAGPWINFTATERLRRKLGDVQHKSNEIAE
jgi:small conductance mechanosensitive channel